MPRQRHAHAALDEALGLAEQAQLGAGHAQRLGHAVEDDALRVDAAIDHRAGAGLFSAVSTGRPRMARACSSNSFCHCVAIVTMPVSCGRGLTSLNQTCVALDEQLDAEQALAAEVVGDRLGDLARALQRRRRHRVRLPALDIVAADLDVADRLAEVRLDCAVGAERAHGQQRDLVVEVDEAFDDHAAVADAAAGHRVVPGLAARRPGRRSCSGPCPSCSSPA